MYNNNNNQKNIISSSTTSNSKQNTPSTCIAIICSFVYNTCFIIYIFIIPIYIYIFFFSFGFIIFANITNYKWIPIIFMYFFFSSSCLYGCVCVFVVWLCWKIVWLNSVFWCFCWNAKCIFFIFDKLWNLSVFFFLVIKKIIQKNC